MIKKILFAFLGLIVILILGIIVFLLTFDLNHYRHFVETRASNALGYTVKIGSMSTKLSFIPTIKVENVRISDANQVEPILDIQKLEATIELTPLMNGEIVVPQISIPQAILVYKGAVSKKENKPKETSSPNKTVANNKTQKIWIDAINIETLKCKIGKEKPYEFDLNKISLKELSKFSFDVVYLKNTVKVSGNFGSILELATKKENLPIDLTLKQDKASLKINGKIGDVENLKKINFQVNGNIPNLSAFLKNWGIKDSKIPTQSLFLKTSFDGDLEKANLGSTNITIGKSDFILNTQGTLNNLKKKPKAVLDTTLSLGTGALNQLWGIKPCEFTCKITADQKIITASELQLNMGKSDASGLLSFSLNTPLLIQGKLNSTYFDIYDIIESQKTASPSTTEAQKKTKRYILSTDKLPYNILNKINTNIQLNISNLKFSNDVSEYAGINTSIIIKNNELRMPTQIRIFGGKIQNQLNVQANKKLVNMETKAEGIQLNKIKQLNKDIKNSLVNLSLVVQASGGSLHDLAASSKGNLTIELTEGQIINKWFNSLPTTLNVLKGKTSALSFSTQDQKTELICGAVNLPIKNGVLTSQNQIAMETDTLNFVVNGQVDLKNETIDLFMIPSISQTRGMANELLGASQAVKLVGPWTNISTKTEPMQAVENLMKVFGKKLTGTSQGNTKTQPVALCEKVLGRTISSPKKVQQKVSPKQTKTQTPAQKPDLKQQLIQSLSQALTDQVAPKKQ